MKKYLNNKEGMALPMVLIIMAILMTFATGLAVLAYNSYVTVRWMDDEKRAYYLARAGVEAASYAYQDAVGKADEGSLATEIDKLIQIGQKGGDNAIITSQKVYAYYTKSDVNSNNRWDGFEFSINSETPKNPGYIGYFEVKIGNGKDKINLGVDENGNPKTSYEDVKVFQSTACVDGITEIVYGYITPTTTLGGGTPLDIYDEDGILYREDVNNLVKFDNATTKNFEYEKLDTSEGNIFLRLFRGFINQVYHQLATVTNPDTGERLFPDIPSNRTCVIYSKVADGDVVLERPKNSDYIKGNPEAPNKAAGNFGDNLYVVSAGGNIFLNDVGIDVTPSKGQYNSIGLYGDQIIIDGNIILYAYITNPDSWIDNTGLNATLQLIGNRFRLGTVLLGYGGTNINEENLKTNTGITDREGKDVPANKVYFNGNVVLKLEVQGSGVETYRIFNAGDMAFFYGSYQESDADTGEESVGIDLLKYFVDAVIAGKEGYDIYGEKVIEKMKKVRSIYYSDETPSYFESDKVVLFKRLQVTINGGEVLVNGQKDMLEETIQPSPSSPSKIKWGTPRESDVFHP